MNRHLCFLGCLLQLAFLFLPSLAHAQAISPSNGPNETQPMVTRSLDELEELFYWCTSGGNTLVVNVAPDQSGRIRENEANTIVALNKERLHLEPGKPLPQGGKVISLGAEAVASSVYENDERHTARWAVDGGMQTRWAAAEKQAELVVSLDPEEAFNKITIFEYCDVKTGADGFSNERVNRIRSYRIDAWLDHSWKCIYVSDESMGDCKVIRFPHFYQTEKIRLKILDAS